LKYASSRRLTMSGRDYGTRAGWQKWKTKSFVSRRLHTYGFLISEARRGMAVWVTGMRSVGRLIGWVVETHRPAAAEFVTAADTGVLTFRRHTVVGVFCTIAGWIIYAVLTHFVYLLTIITATLCFSKNAPTLASCCFDKYGLTVIIFWWPLSPLTNCFVERRWRFVICLPMSMRCFKSLVSRTCILYRDARWNISLCNIKKFHENFEIFQDPFFEIFHETFNFQY